MQTGVAGQRLPGDSLKPAALKVLLVGAGGHALTVADILLRMRERTGEVEPVGFLDDDPALTGRKILGLPVLGASGDIGRVAHDAVIVAIGINAVRRQVFERLHAAGSRFAIARHPDTVIAPDVRIGPGTVLHPGLVIESGTTIGANAILSSSCSVSHNTRVEDHVHIGFGSRIGAGLVVEEGAMVGMGATIVSQKNVGAWSVVGAAACVIRPVPPGVTVVGVPARLLEKKG